MMEVKSKLKDWRKDVNNQPHLERGTNIILVGVGCNSENTSLEYRVKVWSQYKLVEPTPTSCFPLQSWYTLVLWF
jgi:hypothetical protein